MSDRGTPRTPSALIKKYALSRIPSAAMSTIFIMYLIQAGKNGSLFLVAWECTLKFLRCKFSESACFFGIALDVLSSRAESSFLRKTTSDFSFERITTVTCIIIIIIIINASEMRSIFIFFSSTYYPTILYYCIIVLSDHFQRQL